MPVVGLGARFFNVNLRFFASKKIYDKRHGQKRTFWTISGILGLSDVNQGLFFEQKWVPRDHSFLIFGTRSAL